MIETIDLEKCTGCGICVDRCPLDTLSLDPFQREMPPCQSACPAAVDIRSYQHFMKQRSPRLASRILGQHLPYPAITGRLCHKPCQRSCARGAVDEAVNIPALERYLGDVLLEQDVEKPERLHAKEVAVIGSGPAGLAGAYFLIRLGYGVNVFEKSSVIGGSLREEAAKNRLPEEVLDGQIRMMKEMGVEFNSKKEMQWEIAFAGENGQPFDAVLLAMGPGSHLSTYAAQLQTGDIHAGVFSCGGVVKQREPIIQVIGSVKQTVARMDAYLRIDTFSPGTEEPHRSVKRLPGEGIIPENRKLLISGSTAQLNREQALMEARRCMTCGAKAFIAHPEDCMTCFMCEMSCPSQAITVHPFKEVIPTPIQYPVGGEGHV